MNGHYQHAELVKFTSGSKRTEGSLPCLNALMIPYICNFLFTSASLSLGSIGLLTVGSVVAMSAAVAVTCCFRGW